MFTGIIRHIGTVRSARPSQGGRRLSIDLGPLTEGLGHGDSVAVNGLCLTAGEIRGAEAEFDVITESLNRSTLGDLQPGGRVNLERALPADGRFDGHIVQGHIDGLAETIDIRRTGQWVIRFRADRDILDAMVPKGSVALDGVSLTLSDLNRDSFAVSLIPTTIAETTLADIRPGRRVNVETDILGKYVRQYLSSQMGLAGESGLSIESLRRAGFL